MSWWNTSKYGSIQFPRATFVFLDRFSQMAGISDKLRHGLNRIVWQSVIWLFTFFLSRIMKSVSKNLPQTQHKAVWKGLFAPYFCPIQVMVMDPFQPVSPALHGPGSVSPQKKHNKSSPCSETWEFAAQQWLVPTFETVISSLGSTIVRRTTFWEP